MSQPKCLMEEMEPVSKMGKGNEGKERKGKHRSPSAELRRNSKKQNQCQDGRAQSKLCTRQVNQKRI